MSRRRLLNPIWVYLSFVSLRSQKFATKSKDDSQSSKGEKRVQCTFKQPMDKIWPEGSFKDELS